MSSLLRRLFRRLRHPVATPHPARAATATALAFTLPKTGEPPDSNADAWEERLDTGTFVVLDGVSQSFDSGRWARLLGTALCDGGTVDEAAERCAGAFAAGTPDVLPWWLQERAGAGAHCTYLRAAASVADDGVRLRCDAVGDCVLLAVRNTEMGAETASWPFQTVDEMPSRPRVVSSMSPFVPAEGPMRTEILLARGDRVFLMSDALGRYVLRQRGTGSAPDGWWPFLAGSLTHDEFESWIARLRSSGELEDDDVTVGEVLWS